MDEFQKHLAQQGCGEQPAQETKYQIYNMKLVLSWIKGSQSNGILLTAKKYAVDAVRERALELGRQEWQEDPWGHSGRGNRN